jgi:cobaltochelatase CobN
LAAYPPDIIVNATAFATATAHDDAGVLSASGCPILQVAQAGISRASWESSSRGLMPRDLAMHVVLPEVDGRIFANVIAFKERGESDAGFAPTTFRPVEDRINATADLARAWVRLRRTSGDQRRVAIVLANYPSRDGRLANGVGLDTPQSLIDVLGAMRGAGYAVEYHPADTASMMQLLQAGPTNALEERGDRAGGVSWPVPDYLAAFAELPEAVRRAVESRWGDPAQDPHAVNGSFRLGLHRFGNAVVGVQPARGYNIDPKATYHDPDLVPPHHYLAFYLWIRRHFDAHAVVHLGKHGNLEWLPGKSTGLSANCLPDAVLGRCRISIPLLSTIPARAFRPSAVRPPSSSTI